MKHYATDGLGPREVWLDGVLLDRVIECDDELGTAIVSFDPVRVVNSCIVFDRIQGDCMVVRSIEVVSN